MPHNAYASRPIHAPSAPPFRVEAQNAHLGTLQPCKAGPNAAQPHTLGPQTHAHRAAPSPSHPRTFCSTQPDATPPIRAPAFPRWGPKRTLRDTPTVQNGPQPCTTPHVGAQNAHSGTRQVCEVGPQLGCGDVGGGMVAGQRVGGRVAGQRAGRRGSRRSVGARGRGTSGAVAAQAGIWTRP